MYQKVIAREYKVMLRTERFAGEEEQFLKAANEFWRDLTQAIRPHVIAIDGNFQDIREKDKRFISFYDTDSRLLYGSDYILRERREVNSGKREVTLKFRHPDRYIAQDRKMDAVEPDQENSKFEEDIKPSKDSKFSFSVLYSFSTTQKLLDSQSLNQLKDITQLYPDLKDQMPDYQAEEPLNIVKHTVLELVTKGVTFQIMREPNVDAKCALVAWYVPDEAGTKPVVVEFSFRYGDEEEDYPRKLAQRGYYTFQALQQLTAWVDPNSQTKTAYIYSNE